MIYLDNASTTRIDPEVLNAMMPYLTDQYGNPGTIYDLGRQAAEAVQNARVQVADFIGAQPEQIIFTSGGSEANNLALIGLENYLLYFKKHHIVTTDIEHDSLLRAADSLSSDGIDVTYVKPRKEGHVSQMYIAGAIRKDTGLVSVMYANNETGVFNPVKEIGDYCQRTNILFHTDCVQAAGCFDIDVEEIGCDFLSLSSHKIHGPKGVGALYVRDRSLLSPIIHGGEAQEFGLRGGTENVAGIVGFGKACELISESHMNYVEDLRCKFYAELANILSDTNPALRLHLNGNALSNGGKVLNLRVDGVDGEALLLMLNARGVCVSAGSACRSHESEPSRVLTSMGISGEDARNSIRFSFSRMNTEEEVKKAAEIVANCVDTLVSGKYN